ncbi:MAG TPA: methyltransferase domain-containing protein [Ktedonobacterales bacterium]|nr:methyltransferase domain-containing protein [Ktedonobacterales bacterium]
MGSGNWFRRLFGSKKSSGGTFYGDEALMEGDFVIAKGRKHVAMAPYLLPKDLQEGSRLDFQHYMLRYALRGNYAAPITNPREILDIGTGTGRWAFEMAAFFPAANVVGVDLVTPPIPTNAPAQSAPPANYVFVQANVLDGLPFSNNSFDFIHERLLVFGIPTARWPDVFREAYRLARPGGWVESIEADAFPENGGPDMDRIGQWIVELSQRRGIDVFAIRSNGAMLAQAGFTNVSTRDILLPGGATGGRLSGLVATDYFAVVEGLRGAMAAQGIVSSEEFDRVMARARVSINQHPCRFHFPLAIGQKIA